MIEMTHVTYLTPEGYEKLKAELKELKTKGRQEVARAIAEAREKGDLSENAEYDAAKDAQGMLEMRINELERMLASARILDPDQISTDEVRLLSKVTIKNLANGATMTYTLVSEQEADLKQKRISITSPIGKGLLGKKKGEIAEVETPRGKMKFEIVDISI